MENFTYQFDKVVVQQCLSLPSLMNRLDGVIIRVLKVKRQFITNGGMLDVFSFLLGNLLFTLGP